MRLEIDCIRITAKKKCKHEAKQYPIKQPMDHWRNQGNQKYPETNEKENMMIQNLWGCSKAVVRVRLIATQTP